MPACPAVPAFEDYLKQAENDASRPESARLVLMMGLSGSGKTWLARRLAQRSGIIHLRSDFLRKKLAGLGEFDRSHSETGAGIYTSASSDRVYAGLADRAAIALDAGYPAIVDATFLEQSRRASLLEIARQRNARSVILSCEAPVDVLEQRIRARNRAGADASEADLTVLQRQIGQRDDLSESETAIKIVVDTTDLDSDRSIDELADRIGLTR